MIGINDLGEELADDEFIRGIYPSQPFKPMTNNELTIEQLQGIAGGFDTDRKPMSALNSQKDSVVVWKDNNNRRDSSENEIRVEFLQ